MIVERQQFYLKCRKLLLDITKLVNHISILMQWLRNEKKYVLDLHQDGSLIACIVLNVAMLDAQLYEDFIETCNRGSVEYQAAS